MKKNEDNLITPALAAWGVIQLDGAATAHFLQGQLTADLSSLAPGKATLAACCDYKGRVLANFFCWGSHDRYYLLLPFSMQGWLLTHLRKYAVFSKILLTTVADYDLLLWPNELPSDWVSDSTLASSANLTTTASTPLYALMGLTQQLTEWSAANPTAITNTVTIHSLLTHAGIVWIEPETSGLFLPQTLQLEQHGGLSFSKGCYVGQEVIARTHYRGTLKRNLYRLSPNHAAAWPLPIGHRLVNTANEEIGIIVSRPTEPLQGNDCLAVLQDPMINQLTDYQVL